ncbi:MAG: cysteine desulfurase [Thermoprotei archaeon]
MAGSLDTERIRLDFPILSRLIHGKRLVYLDNAATTHKPKQVIDAISNYYSNINSNVHRSPHTLGEEATQAYEDARAKVSRFVHAPSSDTVIFTKNVTESLNLLAYSLGYHLLKPGDRVVVTEMEHHSNFVPWQQIAKRLGAVFDVVGVGDDGEIDVDELDKKLEGAKIFSFTHVSNVLGTITNTKKLVEIGHRHGSVVVVDGAQSVPHMPVDVQSIGCDFYAFTGHKMLGPMGIGCLYGRRDLLEEMPPFLYGGEMISQVTKENSSWNELPWKFEAGTPNVEGAVGLASAVRYLERFGMDKIRSHEIELVRATHEELSKIKGVRIYGPEEAERKGGIVSFNIVGVQPDAVAEVLAREGVTTGSVKIHPHDVATVLDTEGVAIRAGHHCAMPLMIRLGVPATSRASFYIYNDEDDVEQLIKAVKKACEIFHVET